MKSTKPADCLNCPARLKSPFACVGDDLVSRLSEVSITNLYKKGQVIFHEGNRPLGLYVLREGKVKIFKTGVDGGVQIVRLAGVGSLVGYRALLGEQIYSASAEALEDSEICFIEKSAFQKMLREDSTLNTGLLKLLSRELRDAENTLLDLAQKSVRERLAEALLLLKEKYGMSEDGTLDVVLSREELASLVGTVKETLIRGLSDFKDEKILITKGRQIRILDLDRLITVAGM